MNYNVLGAKQPLQKCPSVRLLVRPSVGIYIKKDFEKKENTRSTKKKIKIEETKKEITLPTKKKK